MTNHTYDVVESWRGFDPQWDEFGGLSYTNLLFRGPCELATLALQDDPLMPDRVADLLGEGGAQLGAVRDDPVYVFQLRGHDWTQVIASGEVVLSIEMAEDLSRRYRCQVFMHVFEAAASARAFWIYDSGVLMEAFSMLYDNPVYQGDMGKEDLRRKQADGWKISRDHTFEFYTKRSTALDIESPDECHALLQRVTAGLGMFVAAPPLWYDPTVGRVEPAPKWSLKSFIAAKILYRPRTESHETGAYRSSRPDH